jgi:hypothetical protein
MSNGKTMGKVERPSDRRYTEERSDIRECRKGLRKDLSYDGPLSWKYLWLMMF